MRKIREVLRLRFDIHLGQRQIARGTLLAQSTVHDYLTRFAASGLSWPLPAETTDAELDALLYPPAPPDSGAASVHKPLPDLARIHTELRAGKHTTLQLLWEEYRQDQADPLSYSRFCHHYRDWLGHQNPVMRQVHKAGEKLFVDWAGAKIPVHDQHTGAVHMASLFVATLGASSYTFARAVWTQELGDWIGVHLDAFQFLGGLPELLVPDNLRTGVTKSCRYEPDLNPTYQEMAVHYGLGVVPARVGKARDKAVVEVGVQVAQRWIVAALRHRKFFSLAELNQAIAELLARINQRPFRKRPGSRASLFAELDQPVLRPLPAEPYQHQADWSRATVNIDYHVQCGHSFYSVPHQLVHKVVEVRATPATVEVFHQGARVASHARAAKPETAVTAAEHRPKSHQAHLEWPPSRLVEWAAGVGPHTARLFERILAEKPHPEMGYRACLGVLRLSRKHTPERMERVAEYALAVGACSYKSVKSILLTGLETISTMARMEPPKAQSPAHGNIRGAGYFERGGD